MNVLQEFTPGFLKNELDRIREKAALEKSEENLKLLFSLIDLTSLNTDDSATKIRNMCLKVNDIEKNFPELPNVGAICVYPSLVPVVRENLLAEEVGIASVAAGFPSSQTYPEVKETESRMAVEAGATEIDVVISVGRFLEEDMEFVVSEIRRIRKAIGRAKLKVILETGLLSDPDRIFTASLISMSAGADFIKTSTGKVDPASTPEAVLIMCMAIKTHFGETGRKCGIKPAGGISTAEQALEYAGIVHSVLGKEWLSPSLFRIGASRLANNILSEYSTIKTGSAAEIQYF